MLTLTNKDTFFIEENFIFCTTNDGIFNVYNLITGKKREKIISNFDRAFSAITKFYPSQTEILSITEKR